MCDGYTAGTTLTEEISMAGQIGVPELLLLAFILPSFLLMAWLIGRICRKAGFSIWLGIPGVIPVANSGLLLFLAFTEWPTNARSTTASST